MADSSELGWSVVQERESHLLADDSDDEISTMCSNTQAVKCTFEDQSVARKMIGKGDFMFTFDLKSAYHHIEIFKSHTTFLGFSWVLDGSKRFFIFEVLPFGISVAGFIFTKVLREVVKYWRSRGNRVIMFLDDGIGGHSDFSSAQTLANFIRSSLKDFGFLLAEEKNVCGNQLNVLFG